MKMDPKYIIIFIFIVVWSLSYAGMQEAKKKNINNKKTDSPVVNNLGDSVKVTPNGDLKVYFFNVGQADSILIENEGKFMLIDAGNNADGKKIVKHLKKLGVEKLDYLVATHAHEDHIGGMDDIINNFLIDKFYMSDVVTTTKTFDDMITALEEKEVSVNIPKAKDVFLLGSCKMEVVYLGDDEDDLNDSSIIIRGLYGDKSFLFMGDASSKVEKVILNENIDSDVLKVGHHGSKYSTSIGFLKKVTPDVAVISVGEGNSYEHPHGVTMNNLNKNDVDVYRTDVDGTIMVTTDGVSFNVEKLEVNLNG